MDSTVVETSRRNLSLRVLFLKPPHKSAAVKLTYPKRLVLSFGDKWIPT